ncbi:Spx/MgsR family RNA polymerase-binding regulatory protein [Candidatus Saccharibacteria bacterium TM7i]|nr:Spx/MgsR family RNA polymerase-binding regulatory protein [Candidatus Saccharibacteria bacterium TM7i]
MAINFICYKKCSTCKKAEKFLRDNDIGFTPRDYTDQPLGATEITTLWQKSNLPLSRLFNTSGILYREFDMKNRLPTLSEDEQIKILSENPKLIKRPIIETKETVLIGFRQPEWEAVLLTKAQEPSV